LNKVGYWILVWKLSGAGNIRDALTLPK